MSDENLQDNPFAAPTESLHAAAPEATDDWYELRGETLVCRSSLRLPRYCLVTGKACPDSVALNFPLYYQPGFSVSSVGSRLIVIFLAVVWIVGCIVLEGILTSRGAPVAGIIAFAIVGIGIPLAVGLMAVHRSSSATKLLVKAFLSPGKHRARQWISWLPLVLIVPMMASDSMGVLPRGIGSLWFLPFLVMNIISQRLWLRGLRLKLKPREDGLYEVTGFSPAFLERLREQAAVRQA
ncbi:MAG: hypothetical protein ACK46M_03070 [Planctomyces sp.]|jgi:hypothetical protein